MRTGSGGPCNHCGRTSSPCWRKGPDTKPTLCNACGARWLVKKNLDNYMPGAGSPTQRQSPSPFAHGAGGKSKLGSAFYQSTGGYQSFGGGSKSRKRKAPSPGGVPVTYAEIATTARIFSDPPSPLRTTTITVQHSPPVDRTTHAAGGTAFTLQLPSGEVRPGFTVTHEFTFPSTIPPERKGGEAAQFTNITASTLALLHATPNGTLSHGSIPVVRRRRKPDRSTVRTVF